MRIAFTGAQGTGKSTLVDILMKKYNFQRASAPQRILKEINPNFPINQDTDNLSQSAITAIYIMELIKNNSNYISDRSLIDAFAYMDASKNISDNDKAKLLNYYESFIELYDCIFYIPIEFEAEEDGIRVTDKDYQKEIDENILKYINKYNSKVKIITITGSIEERLIKIEGILNAYKP